MLNMEFLVVFQTSYDMQFNQMNIWVITLNWFAISNFQKS